MFETSSTLRIGPGRPIQLLTGRSGQPKKLFHMVNEYVAVVDNLDPGTVKEALQSPEEMTAKLQWKPNIRHSRKIIHGQ